MGSSGGGLEGCSSEPVFLFFWGFFLLSFLFFHLHEDFADVENSGGGVEAAPHDEEG